MFSFLKQKRNPHEDKTRKVLSHFHPSHIVDEAYLKDLFGQASQKTEAERVELSKMVDIVELATKPMGLVVHTSNTRLDAFDYRQVGYFFGFFDVFKTHVWEFQEFNRSFFHSAFFFLASSALGLSTQQKIDYASDALMTFGSALANQSDAFKEGMKIGTSDAVEFLDEKKPPMGLMRL